VKTLAANVVCDMLQRADGIVACDADGTLWTGDVGEDFFFHVLEHERLLPPAIDAARAIASAYGISGRDGKGTLEAIYGAYRAGTFPEDLVCEIMAWCLAGRDRESVRDIAKRVHRPGELEGRLVAETKLVLDHAREFWIVSASPASIVRVALESIGFDPERCVALEVEYERDVMQPRAIRPIPYSDGKVTNLRAKIGQRPIAVALGDSAFDIPMLAQARVGLAVRPKPLLRERAPESISILEI
jgi:phosphoserine phosphatase